MRVRLHAPGAGGHGVARHAAALARLLAARGAEVVGPGADTGVDTGVDTDVDVVHAQFTDALWGPDIASAATAFVEWSAATTRPVVVTLHDVPGGDVDAARDARRRAGYARVVAAADAVVVSAGHEAAKVSALTGRVPDVIGLPVEPLPAGPAPSWADRPTLGVLGFVYPGKGHAEVIAAAGRRPDRPRVVAAGAVSPGHGDLWSALVARAAGAGVDLVLTGSLDDAGMGAAARAVTVPIAPGASVSASGTLATWWGCGRRPLTADGPYAREQDPGTVTLYGPDGIDSAVALALARPERTHLATTPVGPDVAAAHERVYAQALTGGAPC
jgi:hypothetical protein